MKNIARTPTRTIHIQREVDGRTHQANALAHFDQKRGEYVVPPEDLRRAEHALMAEVAREPPSAARVAWLRTALGLSIDELALRTNVSAAALSSWESGAAEVPAGAWSSLGRVVDASASTERPRWL